MAFNTFYTVHDVRSPLFDHVFQSFYGRQEEVAEMACSWIFGAHSKRDVRGLVDYIRTQRSVNPGRFITWRGVTFCTDARGTWCRRDVTGTDAEPHKEDHARALERYGFNYETPMERRPRFD